MHTIIGNDVEKLITIYNRAVGGDALHAVAITVKRDTEIRLLAQHPRLQCGRRGRPDIAVDVVAIWFGTYHHHSCAQLS